MFFFKLFILIVGVILIFVWIAFSDHLVEKKLDLSFVEFTTPIFDEQVIIIAELHYICASR